MNPEPDAVVIYTRGPRWDADAKLLSQDHVVGHLAFIRALVRDGVVRAAGPFWRLDQRVEGDTVGVIVLTVPPERARELVAGDPSVRHELMTATVHAFYPAS